jgi:hypothetical protein
VACAATIVGAARIADDRAVAERARTIGKDDFTG